MSHGDASRWNAVSTGPASDPFTSAVLLYKVILMSMKTFLKHQLHCSAHGIATDFFFGRRLICIYRLMYLISVNILNA